MYAYLLSAVIALAGLSTSASAAVLIGGDNGGRMDDYWTRFRKLRNSGEAVVINGTCNSACTMVLGMVPPERICATPNAVLGFHAAWEFSRSGARITSRSGTRELMKTYPSAVRTWITRHGGLTRGMKFMRGADLSAIIAPCSPGIRAAATSATRRGSVREARRGGVRRASLKAR